MVVSELMAVLTVKTIFSELGIPNMVMLPGNTTPFAFTPKVCFPLERIKFSEWLNVGRPGGERELCSSKVKLDGHPMCILPNLCLPPKTWVAVAY